MSRRKRDPLMDQILEGPFTNPFSGRQLSSLLLNPPPLPPRNAWPPPPSATAMPASTPDQPNIADLANSELVDGRWRLKEEVVAARWPGGWREEVPQEPEEKQPPAKKYKLVHVPGASSKVHSSATEVPSKAKSKAASPVQRKPHSSKVANRPKAHTKEPWHQAGPTKVTQPRAKGTMMPKHKAAKVPQTPIRKHKVVHSTPKPKASLLANPKAPLLATPKASQLATPKATLLATPKATLMATSKASQQATSKATLLATSKASQQATPKATSKAPLLATSKASLATPKAMPAPETPRRSLRPSVRTPRYDAHLAVYLTPRRGGLDAAPAALTPLTGPSLPSGAVTPQLGSLATSTPKLGPRLAMVDEGALTTPRRSRRLDEMQSKVQEFRYEPTISDVKTPKSKAKKVVVNKLRKSDMEFKTPKTRSSINKIEETPKSVKKVEEKQEEAEESMMEGEAACGKTHRMVACGKCPGCKRADCQECVSCRDMIKYGGSGRRRARCRERGCAARRLSTCPACLTQA